MDKGELYQRVYEEAKDRFVGFAKKHGAGEDAEDFFHMAFLAAFGKGYTGTVEEVKKIVFRSMVRKMSDRWNSSEVRSRVAFAPEKTTIDGQVEESLADYITSGIFLIARIRLRLEWKKKQHLFPLYGLFVDAFIGGGWTVKVVSEQLRVSAPTASRRMSEWLKFLDQHQDIRTSLEERCADRVRLISMVPREMIKEVEGWFLEAHKRIKQEKAPSVDGAPSAEAEG